MTTDVSKALQRVNAIRQERDAAYGDSWRDIGLEGNAFCIVQKASRMKALLDKRDLQNERALDTAVDLANYCLFFIELHGSKPTPIRLSVGPCAVSEVRVKRKYARRTPDEKKAPIVKKKRGRPPKIKHEVVVETGGGGRTIKRIRGKRGRAARAKRNHRTAKTVKTRLFSWKRGKPRIHLFRLEG